ncbi:MAG: hypothetical protein H9W81_13905 [Enterococcus sp.]|nr:hypothetical protein [Enterococcus sp.]
MITSDTFFDSMSTLMDEISTDFEFDPEVSDSGSDCYSRTTRSGKTYLTINYAQEKVFIEHTSQQDDRIINLEYRKPSMVRVLEITECVQHL